MTEDQQQRREAAYDRAIDGVALVQALRRDDLEAADALLIQHDPVALIGALAGVAHDVAAMLTPDPQAALDRLRQHYVAARAVSL